MDIQRKAFEESNNVNPDWSFKFDEELQQYIAVDFEMTSQVDEFNERWDTFCAGWQTAKAQVVPDQLDVNSILHDIDCYFDSGLSNTERTANNLIQSIYEKLSGEIKAQEQSDV